MCLDDLRHYTQFVPLPDTHIYASFNHLGGYSSFYYIYMWDKVIAEDFFQQCDQQNLLPGDIHALSASGGGAWRIHVCQ